MSNRQDMGTSLSVPLNSTHEVDLKNSAGNYTFVTCAGTPTIPSAVAGYAVGCLLIDTTNGDLYHNSGTTASCIFTTKVTFA